jgi:AbiV family abortive infection protein
MVTTMAKKTTTQPTVAPDVLLLGALYALEQCGILLSDAAELVELRRYPTAAGIALRAREELGRHKMLLKFWGDSIKGESVARDTLETALQNHENKQRHGSLSLSYMLEPGNQLSRLHRARLNALPGSDEWRAADNQIRLIDDDPEPPSPRASPSVGSHPASLRGGADFELTNMRTACRICNQVGSGFPKAISARNCYRSPRPC